MLSFHCEMRHKERLLEEADELSQSIGVIRNQLAEARTSDERNFLTQVLSSKTRQFWEIECMPTSPVHMALVRKFTVANARSSRHS
jgi:hypothetical protein